MRTLLRNLPLLLIAVAIVAPTQLRAQQPDPGEASETLSDSQLRPLTAAVLERYLTTIEALAAEGKQAAERLTGLDYLAERIRGEVTGETEE